MAAKAIKQAAPELIPRIEEMSGFLVKPFINKPATAVNSLQSLTRREILALQSFKIYESY